MRRDPGRSLRYPGGIMNALDLLAHDHLGVRQLLEQAQAARNEKEKRRVFRGINDELETHARIEESVFYPAMEEYEELQQMVAESLQEHDKITALLREIRNLKSDGKVFDRKIQVLMDYVRHHAEEEEEGKMFPMIRRIFSSRDLEDLGRDLRAAKNKHQRKAG
jgi:hypothetical protein